MIELVNVHLTLHQQHWANITWFMSLTVLFHLSFLHLFLLDFAQHTNIEIWILHECSLLPLSVEYSEQACIVLVFAFWCKSCWESPQSTHQTRATSCVYDSTAIKHISLDVLRMCSCSYPPCADVCGEIWTEEEDQSIFRMDIELLEEQYSSIRETQRRQTHVTCFKRGENWSLNSIFITESSEEETWTNILCLLKVMCAQKYHFWNVFLQLGEIV